MCALAPADAGAEESRGAGEWADFLAEAFGRAAAELSVVRREAPEPVALSWERRSLGEVTLDGPLLDMRAADLTGDGEDEILALTAQEAVVIEPAAGAAPEVIARFSLTGLDPAPLRPRTPVGTSAVVRAGERLAWWVRSSEVGRAVALVWEDGELAARGRAVGYPVCEGVSLALDRGRSRFSGATAGLGEIGEPLQGARCRRDMVDANGFSLFVYAAVGVSGELEVASEARCRAGQGCEDGAANAGDRGYALAIADFARDGFPDVAAAAHMPPGEPGEVEVFSLRGDELVSLFDASFPGPVRALASGRFRGRDAPDLLVAVASPDGDRVELWTLT